MPSVDFDVPNQLREAFLVNNRENVIAVQCQSNCTIWTGYVADATEIAFRQVNIDFGFLCLLTRDLRLPFNLNGFFRTSQGAYLAAGTTNLVQCQSVILHVQNPF